MAAFEIRVNGDRRFVGRHITAITLAADWVARRKADRVSVHLGLGEPGERQVQYLGADLVPGDEISIRVLADGEPRADATASPNSCSFCGNDIYHITSLVAGPQVAICDACLAAFDAAVNQKAALPVGASIQEKGEARCGFCQKAPPQIPGLLVRNAAALCAECLRPCLDMATVSED